MAAAASRVGRFNLGIGARYLLFPDSSPTYDNLSSVAAVVYRYGAIALGGSAKYVSVEERHGPTTRSVTSAVGLELTVAMGSFPAFRSHRHSSPKPGHAAADSPRQGAPLTTTA